MVYFFPYAHITIFTIHAHLKLLHYWIIEITASSANHNNIAFPAIYMNLSDWVLYLFTGVLQFL